MENFASLVSCVGEVHTGKGKYATEEVLTWYSKRKKYVGLNPSHGPLQAHIPFEGYVLC